MVAMTTVEGPDAVCAEMYDRCPQADKGIILSNEAEAA